MVESYKGAIMKTLDHLTKLQYQVTQEAATEPPFNNPYYDNFKQGIYIDIISREPLFISSDKFDSGCGWPAFSRPINDQLVQINVDNSHGMQRTEVRATTSDSHLGHVFSDGPISAGGRRYCINSAALEFIPANEMEQQGYGQFLNLLDSE